MMVLPYTRVSDISRQAPRPDVALFLPTLYSGGAERVQLNLAEFLIGKGLRVDLVVCKYFGSLKDQVPPGVRLVNLGARKVMTSLGSYLRYLAAAQPPVVLSSVENANVISCLGRVASRHTHRLIVRLDSSLKYSGPLLRRIERWPLVAALAATFPAADALVACSDGLKQQLMRLPAIDKDRIHLIYNPIIHPDFESKFAVRPELPDGADPDLPYVLTVGRLHRQKDQATLLRAFAEAVRHHPAQLVIVGEGDIKSELQALAKSLGIERLVHFAGFSRNPLAWMRHAKVFVLSSIAEGFGNVLVEALASGTTVISTDCPHGPREILARGQHGTLLPVGDAPALATALIAQLRQPKRPMSVELVRHLQAFTIETIGEQYMRLFDLPTGVARIAA